LALGESQKKLSKYLVKKLCIGNEANVGDKDATITIYLRLPVDNYEDHQICHLLINNNRT